jgi:hypothetical protein
LSELTGQVMPEFLALEEKYQHAIIQMLLDWMNPKNKHWGYDEHARMSKTYLRDLWINDRVANSVISQGYFEVLKADEDQGWCRGFRPSAPLVSAVEKLMLEPTGQLLVRSLMPKTVATNAVSSRVRYKRSKDAKQQKITVRKSGWIGVNCATTVPINQAELERYIEVCQDPEYREEAMQWLSLSRNTLCPGHIPVQYIQVPSGRIYEDTFAMQSMSRSVRQAALSGLHDYDISNCHFAILSQWASRKGLVTPRVNHYLDNKKSVREAIANACYADVNDVKRALISLLYGAVPRGKSGMTSIKQEYSFGLSSLESTLGRAQAHYFAQLPVVGEMVEEIEVTRKKLVDSIPLVRGRRQNHFGGIFESLSPAGNKPYAKLLCHYLQGFEASALRGVVTEFGSKIVLCMHDGWISRTPLSIDHLTGLISEATGFALEVEHKEIVFTGQPIRKSQLPPVPF